MGAPKSATGKNDPDDSEPRSSGVSPAEDTLNAMAKEYYTATNPWRQEYLNQTMALLKGTTNPESLPGVKNLNTLSLQNVNAEYEKARNNIIATIPKGGRLSEALANLESKRASDIATAITQNAANAANQYLQSGYQAAFGAPAVANQGLGEAAGSYASRYGAREASQAGRYNTMGDVWGSVYGGNSQQASSASNAVGNLCCFIFLAARGPLDPVVRRYRDEHLTPRNRRGYYRMADWLVPRMERSWLWRRAVQFLMVDPMTSYGRYHYGTGRIGVLFAPLTHAWLTVFRLMGFGTYIRSNGEEV